MRNYLHVVPFPQADFLKLSPEQALVLEGSNEKANRFFKRLTNNSLATHIPSAQTCEQIGAPQFVGQAQS